MKNNQIGALIILGGIAVLGFVYFKRNKPKTAEKQLADLTAQSNDIKNTINVIDKPFYTPEQQQEVVKDIAQANLIENNIQNLFAPDFNTMPAADVQALQQQLSGINWEALANYGSYGVQQNLANSNNAGYNGMNSVFNITI